MSPVTFKKFYVTTVNNSFQALPIFCHKKLHLRCCEGLELNTAIWSMKILKGIRGKPPRIKHNFGKIWKTHSPRCSKNTVPEVFHINFFWFHQRQHNSKIACKVEYISQINGGLMFFGNSKIRFFKISWLDCDQYGKESYKKKNYNQQSSVL